jgi:hypothetical protein
MTSTKKPTRAAICRTYRITSATLAAWELEGIDPWNDLQMNERNSRKHKSSGQELYEARLQKLKGEARCATLKAAQLEGTLVDLAEVEACFVRIGAVTKSLLIRMQADLPPALEGQSASRMAKIISEAVESVLRSMSDPEGAAWREK